LSCRTSTVLGMLVVWLSRCRGLRAVTHPAPQATAPMPLYKPPTPSRLSTARNAFSTEPCSCSNNDTNNTTNRQDMSDAAMMSFRCCCRARLDTPHASCRPQHAASSDNTCPSVPSTHALVCCRHQLLKLHCPSPPVPYPASAVSKNTPLVCLCAVGAALTQPE